MGELMELHKLQEDGRASEWMNGTQMVLALADPQAALADYLANPQYKSGGGEESRAYTLEWIQSLAKLGTPDMLVRGDSAFAVSFLKDEVRSYTAFNPGATDTKVTFSDGTVLRVGAGGMVTKGPDGKIV